jgi:hypothetical protein
VRLVRPVAALVKSRAVPQGHVTVFVLPPVGDNANYSLSAAERCRQRSFLILPNSLRGPHSGRGSGDAPTDERVAVAGGEERTERRVAEDVLLPVATREAVPADGRQVDGVAADGVSSAVAVQRPGETDGGRAVLDVLEQLGVGVAGGSTDVV